jgi:hypothetical protein
MTYPILFGNTASSGASLFESYFPIGSAIGDNTSNMLSVTVPSGYKDLRITYALRGVRSFAAEQVYFRINNNSNSDYAYKSVVGSGSSPTYGTNTKEQSLIYVSDMPAANAPANYYGQGVIDVFNYSDTAFKSFRSFVGFDVGTDSAGTGIKMINFGNHMSKATAPVTSIQIFSNGAFTNLSHVQVYGVIG